MVLSEGCDACRESLLVLCGRHTSFWACVIFQSDSLVAKEKQCLELEARVQDMVAGRMLNQIVMQQVVASSFRFISKSENRTGSSGIGAVTIA